MFAVFVRRVDFDSPVVESDAEEGFIENHVPCGDGEVDAGLPGGFGGGFEAFDKARRENEQTEQSGKEHYGEKLNFAYFPVEEERDGCGDSASYRVAYHSSAGVGAEEHGRGEREYAESDPAHFCSGCIQKERQEKSSEQSGEHRKAVLMRKLRAYLVDSGEVLLNYGEKDKENDNCESGKQRQRVAFCEIQVVVDCKIDNVDHAHFPDFKDGEQRVFRRQQGGQGEEKIPEVNPCARIRQERAQAAAQDERADDCRRGKIDQRDFHSARGSAVELVREEVDGSLLEHEQRQNQGNDAPVQQTAVHREENCRRRYAEESRCEDEIFQIPPQKLAHV